MSLSHRAARRLRRVAARLDQRGFLASSSSAQGSRKSTNFFDAYPRFYETSQTTAWRGRLNLRYEAIFGENRDIFAGARVLDIASHDGRWSLAALATGAESVIGIEARPDLVQHAVQSLGQYGYGPDRCSFVTADVFDAFDKQTFDVDVVLCLGFLYHTLRYNELLHGIRRANPRHLIIDTVAKPMMRRQAAVYLAREHAVREGNAVNDRYSDGDMVLVGKPNLKAIQRMAAAYDFKVERLSDWAGLIRDNPDVTGLGPYTEQNRITIRCAESLARES
jgi:predicted nicotinamide N-methyase